MKVRNYIAVLSALALVEGAVAQPQDPKPVQPPVVEIPKEAPAGRPAGTEKTPRQLAMEVLQSKGWATGYDPEKKQFIVVGEAAIPVQPGEDAFGDARLEAFAEAMLDAKRQLSNFIGAEVKRRVGADRSRPNTYKESKNKAAEQKKQQVGLDDMSMLDKVTYAAHQEVNNLIKDRGYAPEETTKILQEAEKVVFTKAFTDKIDVASRAEVAGLATYQVFESRGRIGLIGIYNEKTTHALAAAMLGKGSVDRKSGKSTLLDYAAGLQADGSLMFTQGVRLRTDQNGDLNLIAFGHATAEYDDPDFIIDAGLEAETVAWGELRSFAGELVDNSTALDRASTTEKIEVEKRKLETRYKSRKSFNSSVQAVSASLGIQGSAPFYQNEYIHPDMELNGDTRPTVVVLVNWNISSAKDSATLRQKMVELKGSQGGAGVQVKPEPEPVAGEAAGQKDAAKRGGVKKGAGGDDDDFGGGGPRE